MAFKYSCADVAFPLLKHDVLIKLIGLMEFEGIDITLFQDRSHLQPSKIFEKVEKYGEDIYRKTQEAELEVADVFLQCHLDSDAQAINHPQKAIRKHTLDWYKKTLTYAKLCKAKHITILPGVHFPNEDYETSFERTKKELKLRMELAQEKDIIMSIEPHLGCIVDTPKMAERLVEELPGLTLTLDYTHFAKIDLPDCEVEPLMKYAAHFHSRGAKKGMLQCNMEENTIDYTRIVELMKETGYEGFIGVEYIWTAWENCNKCDNISQSILLRDLMMRAEQNLLKGK